MAVIITGLPVGMAALGIGSARMCANSLWCAKRERQDQKTSHAPIPYRIEFSSRIPRVESRERADRGLRQISR